MDKKEIYDKLALLWKRAAEEHSREIKEASWNELRSRIAVFVEQKPEIKENTTLKCYCALNNYAERKKI